MRWLSLEKLYGESMARIKPEWQVINELKEIQYRYVYAITKAIKFVHGTKAKRKHVWDARCSILAEKFRCLADNEVGGLSDTRSIGR